ncbi:MAG: amidohydrolase family protein [Myxococcota bacterium]|nr:amidohydrolase family protein [Myxococcota bacterium]
MRIDAHQHYWRYDQNRDTWITDEMSVLKRDYLPTDLNEHLSDQMMDGSILVQADQSIAETEFLLELAEYSSTAIGVVGWVDLVSEDIERQLDRFTQFEAFRGVRNIAQTEPDDFLARDDVIEGIGKLRAYGLTYDILVYPEQLPSAIRLVQRLPDQPFVLDHIAKPSIRDSTLSPWSDLISELASHDNVWCKVSGLVTEANWRSWKPEDFRPYLDIVFSAFEPNRLMFGSDWPVCLLAASYDEVVGLVNDYSRHLSETDRRSLFGGTAQSFYGVPLQTA